MAGHCRKTPGRLVGQRAHAQVRPVNVTVIFPVMVGAGEMLAQQLRLVRVG